MRRPRQGIYAFTLAFGVKEDPGAKLPYHQIDKNDYWVDDGDSAYYNLLVNTDDVVKDWDSAEHLSSIVPFYNYCLALDYNSERIPARAPRCFCMHGAGCGDRHRRLREDSGGADARPCPDRGRGLPDHYCVGAG